MKITLNWVCDKINFKNINKFVPSPRGKWVIYLWPSLEVKRQNICYMPVFCSFFYSFLFYFNVNLKWMQHIRLILYIYIYVELVKLVTLTSSFCFACLLITFFFGFIHIQTCIFAAADEKTREYPFLLKKEMTSGRYTVLFGLSCFDQRKEREEWIDFPSLKLERRKDSMRRLKSLRFERWNMNSSVSAQLPPCMPSVDGSIWCGVELLDPRKRGQRPGLMVDCAMRNDCDPILAQKKPSQLLFPTDFLPPFVPNFPRFSHCTHT